MGSVFVARVTSDNRVRIPKEVRAALCLGERDTVSLEIGDDGRVIARKASPSDYELGHAIEPSFAEWISPEDDAAYSSL
jgi:bifunctional DNA-binding transcriptional regulator/antitoxin component of YhaV-PrlF toxin-antitoxin module